MTMIASTMQDSIAESTNHCRKIVQSHDLRSMTLGNDWKYTTITFDAWKANPTGAWDIKYLDLRIAMYHTQSVGRVDEEVLLDQIRAL